MTMFPSEDLEYLAQKILAGDVVFFIGAGFSLDSERNTANRLIGRLLARFDAMTECLTRITEHDIKKSALTNEDPDLKKSTIKLKKKRIEKAKDINQMAKELREALSNTFDLTKDTRNEADSPSIYITPDNIWKLSDSYFGTNDWMCSAFNALLGAFKYLQYLTRKVKDINRYENKVLLNDATPIEPISIGQLLKLDPSGRGKALFLDTMGFANPAIMGGDPMADDLDKVARSYEGRLRPRHHVLARFAREGFCSTLLTTNYDLLIEGGYRLAGFSKPQESTNPTQAPNNFLPPTTYQQFCRVADALQFFGRGDLQRTALVVKFHGCADEYRKARHIPTGKWTPEKWQAYLPAMVFTYREIQNWREDAWSRDYIRTLARTHTLVFCGYSLSDAVLHDTFRTVYEEMSTRQQTATEHRADGASTARAPAFFIGTVGKTEFHGQEILRAASRAIGKRPGLINHPNYLRFYLENDDQKCFPQLDELMRWLFHCTFRLRQRQALESDLGRVATQLRGHPCREKERQAIVTCFDKLCQEEQKTAENWTTEAGARFAFERIVNWTDHFHVAFLRELATAEMVMRHQGFQGHLSSFRHQPWYYPTTDHADWTAWGVVVELALRHMVAAWRGVPSDEVWQDTPWVNPGRPGTPHPTIFFTRGTPNVNVAKRCLMIKLTGLEYGRRNARIEGALRFRHPHLWELHAHTLPWWHYRGRDDNSLPDTTPSANVLWQWAAGIPKEEDKNNKTNFLGQHDGNDHQ